MTRKVKNELQPALQTLTVRDAGQKFAYTYGDTPARRATRAYTHATVELEPKVFVGHRFYYQGVDLDLDPAWERIVIAAFYSRKRRRFHFEDGAAEFVVEHEESIEDAWISADGEIVTMHQFRITGDFYKHIDVDLPAVVIDEVFYQVEGSTALKPETYHTRRDLAEKAAAENADHWKGPRRYQVIEVEGGPETQAKDAEQKRDALVGQRVELLNIDRSCTTGTVTEVVQINTARRRISVTLDDGAQRAFEHSTRRPRWGQQQRAQVNFSILHSAFTVPACDDLQPGTHYGTLHPYHGVVEAVPGADKVTLGDEDAADQAMRNADYWSQVRAGVVPVLIEVKEAL